MLLGAILIFLLFLALAFFEEQDCARCFLGYGVPHFYFSHRRQMCKISIHPSGRVGGSISVASIVGRNGRILLSFINLKREVVFFGSKPTLFWIYGIFCIFGRLVLAPLLYLFYWIALGIAAGLSRTGDGRCRFESIASFPPSSCLHYSPYLCQDRGS